MSQALSRRIARLEKRALPFIKQRVGMLEQWATVRRGAVAHASVLAFLLRYGNPKPNEPLSEAYERVNESQGWKSYRAIMPPYLTIIEYEEKFSPNGRGSVIEIGEVLRHLFVPNLPGSNEKAKLSAIFESAPPWLIWFTFADYTAAVLDLKLPDLSSMKSVARFRKVFDMWWGLPSGTFEVHAWPKHHESELTRTDLSLLRPEPVPVSLTRRERKRMITAPANWPDEWPPLCPLAWLQLLRTNFTSAMAQGGITGFVKDKRHPEFCGEMSPAARYRDVNGLTAAAVAILDCKEI